MHIAFVLIPWFLGTIVGGETPKNENKYVNLQIVLATDTLHAGDADVLRISLTPVEGIHINADPPVEVTLEKNTVVDLDGEPEMSTDKETGFLEVSEPIEQRLSISRKATPGWHAFKGTIVYYFCSETQGWCTKFVQQFSLQVNVTK